MSNTYRLNTWSVEYMQKYPHWKYILWNETGVETLLDFANFKPYLDEKTLNARSNMIRYRILHQYGGVYIDADTVYINKSGKSLDFILQMAEGTGAFVSHERTRKEIIATTVMGSEPQHPFLEALVRSA